MRSMSALDGLALASISLAPTAVVRGQEPEAGPPGKWVFETTFGAGAARGGYGEFLEKPINFDLNISKGTGAWRFGGGLQFGSMAMEPPYEDEKDWARFDTYFFARRLFNHGAGVRPYLEGRAGLARIHARGELFYFDEPANLPSGASPTPFANGVSLTLRPGVELRLNDTIAVDVSAWWTGYKTSAYDLRPELNGPPDPPLSANATGELRLRVRDRGGHHLETARPRRPALAGAESGSVHRDPRAAASSRRRSATPGACLAAGDGPPPRCWAST